TLLLAGAEAQDLPVLAALLEDLPPAASQHSDSGEVTVDVVYDGEDLAEVADLLGMSVQALVAAHSGTISTAAFGGFAPGFAYLLPDAAHPGSPARHGRGARSHHGPRSDDAPRPGGPPWEVPRRAEPRTAVPVGAVGLASRYCGIYPRSSPGGWQLLGRRPRGSRPGHGCASPRSGRRPASRPPPPPWPKRPARPPPSPAGWGVADRTQARGPGIRPWISSPPVR